MIGLVLAGCDGQTEDEAFEARAFGAAYGHFPKLGVELVVSKASGRRVACGYAQPVNGPRAPIVTHPFIWVDGEIYAGERLFEIAEAQTFKLCGRTWVGPDRRRGVSSARAAGTPAGRYRSPAV